MRRSKQRNRKIVVTQYGSGQKPAKQSFRVNVVRMESQKTDTFNDSQVNFNSSTASYGVRLSLKEKIRAECPVIKFFS